MPAPVRDAAGTAAGGVTPAAHEVPPARAGGARGAGGASAPPGDEHVTVLDRQEILAGNEGAGVGASQARDEGGNA